MSISESQEITQELPTSSCQAVSCNIYIFIYQYIYLYISNRSTKYPRTFQRLLLSKFLTQVCELSPSSLLLLILLIHPTKTSTYMVDCITFFFYLPNKTRQPTRWTAYPFIHSTISFLLLKIR